MKLSPLIISCAAVAVLSGTALAWSNEDHEIFDIVSSLEVAEGKGTTFYSFLNTTKGADEKEISKAYRKRSLELHPDKNPDNKEVADRFARLGTIASILRDGEKRKRYDHFYDNGVPKWRGTGYYYSRYRPGLTGVLACLAVFSCFLQYFVFFLQRKLNVDAINRFKDQALEGAWGISKTPLAGRKRIRFKTGGDQNSVVPGMKGGRPVPPGTTIELVVEGTDVWVVDEGVETALTSESVPRPKLSQTWIPNYLYNLYLKLTNQAPAVSYDTTGDSETEVVEEVIVGKDGKETVRVIRKPKGPMKGVLEGSGKIGGRRRKGLLGKKKET